MQTNIKLMLKKKLKTKSSIFFREGMVGDSKGYMKNFVSFDTGRVTLKKAKNGYSELQESMGNSWSDFF